MKQFKTIYFFLAILAASALAQEPIDKKFEIGERTTTITKFNVSDLILFEKNSTSSISVTVIEFHIESNQTMDIALSHCDHLFFSGKMHNGTFVVNWKFVKLAFETECASTGKFIMAVNLTATDGAAHGHVFFTNTTYNRLLLFFFMFLIFSIIGTFLINLILVAYHSCEPMYLDVPVRQLVYNSHHVPDV